mmetsp:Transcript_17317/g.25630  ORF Transcript_17317/g.25630 Transcript_17317/m.25630 type:complete len:90 (-) Transcript_17317:454-723(-)|eukprot:CAMPEP_0194065406 /NCGR_PEP_ID=MMETSP0009_2-20130614/85450_1 /TAXON_ID=210454 /ORGANISM="Grammatophora oceanica, Strain CCMP 410" /LENGTH=89 /DNA_ID=CAMNT_0038718247 /DNA_START=591 /DNA_END=860 /DNA_ORIENTATION=+
MSGSLATQRSAASYFNRENKCGGGKAKSEAFETMESLDQANLKLPQHHDVIDEIGDEQPTVSTNPSAIERSSEKTNLSNQKTRPFSALI